MADQDHELSRYRLEWLIRVCAECLQSDKTRTEMAKCNPELLYTLAMACENYGIDFERLKVSCGNDATDMIAQVLLKAVGVDEPKSMWAERERLNAERIARTYGLLMGKATREPYVQTYGRANRTTHGAVTGRLTPHTEQFDAHVVLYRYWLSTHWYSEVSKLTKEQIEAAMKVQRKKLIEFNFGPSRSYSESEFGTFVHYAYDHGFQFDAHVILFRYLGVFTNNAVGRMFPNAAAAKEPRDRLPRYNQIRLHHRYDPDCHCYACRVDKGLVR